PTGRRQGRAPCRRAVPARRVHRDEYDAPESFRCPVPQQARHGEQWIKEGKQAAHRTRLSCHRFRANEVRLQLSVLASKLRDLWRRLVLPTRIDGWSLTSLQQRLIKTGGRPVKDARYWWLLLARGSSDAPAVRGDASAHMGAASPGELTVGGGAKQPRRREGARQDGCLRNVEEYT